MHIRSLFPALLLASLFALCGSQSAWPQTSAEPAAGTATGPSSASRDGPACLTEPIEVPYSGPSSSDKAEAAGKSVLGSVLGQVSGGSVSSKSKGGSELSRRPRYPKSKLEIEGSDLEVEFQGATDDDLLRVAVRIKKDPDKGGPHLIVLQDINCRVLMPVEVSVFELWDSGGLTVSWSSSTYQNGQVTGSSSGGWSTSWADLVDRYPATSEIPGIWQSYGQTPFKGIRGATADFQPPEGETFKPEDWFVVTHVTTPGSTKNVVATIPVVTELSPGKKDSYQFSQARGVAWQPPAASSLAQSQTLLVAATRGKGLVCDRDCEDILEKINQLECVSDDCSDQKRAVDDALQAHANALQASQDAQNDESRARAAIANAQRNLDRVRADAETAEAKLAVEAEKQQRLQDSLRRGGLGLGAQQTQHAIDYSRGVVAELEDRAEKAQSAVEAARNSLDAAGQALNDAQTAVAAANDDVADKARQLDEAKKALSDCLQHEWERCRAVEELWADYQRCRKRCRAQEDTRSDIDWSRGYVTEGQEDAAAAAGEYDASERARDQWEKGSGELGGSGSESSAAASAAAAEARQKAEQLADAAQQKLTEAENRFGQGDLEGAESAAEEARALQEQATEAMENAADEMRFASEEARRAYQNELQKKLQREKQAQAEAAREAALKSQVCLRYISEYYEAEAGKSSLLQELGGFVAGDAKEAIDQAGSNPANPEKLNEFLEKVEAQRENLERLLSILNGIADNSSMEARSSAFSTALVISGEIAKKIPGLGEFFNFYSSAYDAAVNALFALQEEFVNRYKPMADNFIRVSRPCCSYTYEELDATSLEAKVNETWERFERSNRVALARLSSDSLGKLEVYFKNRLTLKWVRCCLQYTLDNP